MNIHINQDLAPEKTRKTYLRCAGDVLLSDTSSRRRDGPPPAYVSFDPPPPPSSCSSSKRRMHVDSNFFLVPFWFFFLFSFPFSRVSLAAIKIIARVQEFGVGGIKLRVPTKKKREKKKPVWDTKNLTKGVRS